MQAFATEFYGSTAWKECRETYKKFVGGLCEDCLKKGIYNPAEMVHHINHVTPSNIYNPEITLNFKNLKAVCRDCHAAYHSEPRAYKIDENGNVIIKEPN